MGFSSPQLPSSGLVLERHPSAKAAAETFGYNGQYLRRLLRAGRLQGVTIGQVWLIRLSSLEAHLRKGQIGQDLRFGRQRKMAESGEGVAP